MPAAAVCHADTAEGRRPGSAGLAGTVVLTYTEGEADPDESDQEAPDHGKDHARARAPRAAGDEGREEGRQEAGRGGRERGAAARRACRGRSAVGLAAFGRLDRQALSIRCCASSRGSRRETICDAPSGPIVTP